MWHPGEEGRSSLHLSGSKDSSIFTMLCSFLLFLDRIQVSLLRIHLHVLPRQLVSEQNQDKIRTFTNKVKLLHSLVWKLQPNLCNASLELF